MTNKMAARVLTYKLGSSSYGDSKFHGKRVFLNAAKMVPFSAGTNGE